MQQLNNLSERIAARYPSIKAAIDRVIASGWLVLGPEVKAFEQQFASYLGAAHCVGVANGTEAIELGLRALGIGRDDKVATVANAGAYTTTALMAIGATPYFMDVDLDTNVAGVAHVEAALDAGVKAVVVTHLYGLAAPGIGEMARLCVDRNVPLFEDCAQAHGARIGGRRVGTFGDISSFSFYPTKNLGALGDGGAVVTSRRDLAEKVGHLRQYGWTAKYSVEVPGGKNSRLDEIQAAVLKDLLPSLDEDNCRRRVIAKRYSAGLTNKAVATPVVGGDEYVAHLYVVRAPERDSLREHLRARGIASDVHYPIPDYLQPVFGEDFAGIRLPNTERLAGEILTLPCYPEMTDDAVDRVIAAVNGWIA